MSEKQPKLNPEILEEIFHQIKIPSGDDVEPENYPLTNFMLSGKEPFKLALNYYNQMVEASIGQKCITFINYKNEEYTFYRGFSLFNVFGQSLLASVDKITCYKNYPKDLPLFKNVKRLKELIADAFYVLTYTKSFSQIEFIERVELQVSNIQDMMDIHKLPFPCVDLSLKDYGFSRFMKTKFKKFAILNDNFAAKTSVNLNFTKKLTIEDYIDDIDIPNLNFPKIASSFSTKIKCLQNLTIIFIIFVKDDFSITDHFTEEFNQSLSHSLTDIQLTVNFMLYLSCLKQSHSDFYDNTSQDQRYQINQEERTAKRTIASGNLTMDAVLLYELSTPMAYFVSYEVTPRKPNREYIPVSTDSNKNKNNSKNNKVF